MASVLRPARKGDFSNLVNFTSSMNYIHRHLDWRDAMEWLGKPPFWIMEEEQKIIGALSCAPEPKEVAWIRLFVVSMHTLPDRVWQRLFAQSLEDLRMLPNMPVIASLAMREWYEELLKRNGFSHHQDIVVFLFDQEPPPPLRLDPKYHVRELVPSDLEAVRRVDNVAFEPIWRLSMEDLKFAGKKSSYSTVIECDQKIVAYQMSSSTGMYAHLARLAVVPELQGQRLGFALVQNLLDYFINRLNYWGVTLNTQNDNSASIALYHRVGFQETGERFPVYVYKDESVV